MCYNVFAKLNALFPLSPFRIRMMYTVLYMNVTKSIFIRTLMMTTRMMMIVSNIKTIFSKNSHRKAKKCSCLGRIITSQSTAISWKKCLFLRMHSITYTCVLNYYYFVFSHSEKYYGFVPVLLMLVSVSSANCTLNIMILLKPLNHLLTYCNLFTYCFLSLVSVFVYEADEGTVKQCSSSNFSEICICASTNSNSNDQYNISSFQNRQQQS